MIFYTKSAYLSKKAGFTLVEISIVMIIIGLLIGGIFSGMRLIDNANVQKTIQDLKAIESAAITFRDSYRALPGDIRTPAARIPNCNVAPCATGGDGNRNIGTFEYATPMAVTREAYTFWHHLQAAGLLQMDYRNTTDMNFGEGQPSAPIGGGYRLNLFTWWNLTSIATCPVIGVGAGLHITGEALGDMSNATTGLTIPCNTMRRVDEKMDDGSPLLGRLSAGQCIAVYACNTGWVAGGGGQTLVTYDLQGF